MSKFSTRSERMESIFGSFFHELLRLYLLKLVCPSCILICHIIKVLFLIIRLLGLSPLTMHELRETISLNGTYRDIFHLQFVCQTASPGPDRHALNDVDLFF